MKKKKLKLTKTAKNLLILLSSVILYILLSKYGYLAGVNYFYTFLVLVGWAQLCIINLILLILINEF